MLSVNLFVKTDTRHLVCRPTLFPCSDGTLWSLISRSLPPPGSAEQNSWDTFEFWGRFRLVLTLETSEMSAIFQVHNQNNLTSSRGLLG